jgi:FkbM family methyltransferase
LFRILSLVASHAYRSLWGGTLIDFKTIIEDLYFCNFDMQEWINNRFKDERRAILTRSIVDHIVTPEGAKFYLQDPSILYQVIWEYWFDDITKDDIVLDLGANIGSFSIRAAQKAKHVYSVEPLYTEELNANIALNNMKDKITVIPYGIGYGGTISIKYQQREKRVKTFPLKTILKMINAPISFMKCDIEGAEWTINPEDIANIPRMEFEVHDGKDSCMPLNQNLIDYINQHWNTITSKKLIRNPGCYLHAYPKGGS